MRIWRLYDHLYPLFASILVRGLMVGCAGPGGLDTSSDKVSPATTGTNSTDRINPIDNIDSTRNSNPPDNTDPKDDGFAWVPFGPSDPKFPTPIWPAYNFFAKGKCSKLREYLGADGRDIGNRTSGRPWLRSAPQLSTGTRTNGLSRKPTQAPPIHRRSTSLALAPFVKKQRSVTELGMPVIRS